MIYVGGYSETLGGSRLYVKVAVKFFVVYDSVVPVKWYVVDDKLVARKK